MSIWQKLLNEITHRPPRDIPDRRGRNVTSKRVVDGSLRLSVLQLQMNVRVRPAKRKVWHPPQHEEVHKWTQMEDYTDHIWSPTSLLGQFQQHGMLYAVPQLRIIAHPGTPTQVVRLVDNGSEPGSPRVVQSSRHEATKLQIWPYRDAMWWDIVHTGTQLSLKFL